MKKLLVALVVGSVVLTGGCLILPVVVIGGIPQQHSGRRGESKQKEQ